MKGSHTLVLPQKIAEQLNAYNLPGVRFHALTYKPYYFAFKDEVVGGAQLYFTDPSRAQLTAINYYALEALKKWPPPRPKRPAYPNYHRARAKGVPAAAPAPTGRR